MARKGKWVEVSSPREPVADVARRALGDRLALVWRYLKRSSYGAPSDTENVHQLRVNTRRAVAAMKLFESLMPDGRRKWMRRQLKRVRQAAGVARDLDVLLQRFCPLAEAEPEDGPYSALVHHLRVRRQKAQQPIDDVHRTLKRQSFGRRAKRLVGRVKLRTKEDRYDKPTFAEAARTALDPMVQAFFRSADVDFSNDELLHAFRIQGKHLRYAMEVFAGAFEPSFRGELYPLIVALQDRLGEINDRATARQRFGEWLAESECGEELRPLLVSLRDDAQRELESFRAAFIEWWTPARRDDLRARFAHALGLAAVDGAAQPSGTEPVLPPVE